MTGGAVESVRQVQLSDGILDYTLRRSRRARRLRVTVDPARGVVVTLPASGPLRVIEPFLRERESWLRRHLEANERQRALVAANRPAGPGGWLPFRGELHHVRVERAPRGTRRSSVLRVGGDDRDELVIVLTPAGRRSPASVLEAWLRERADAAIRAEIARHAPGLGVDPAAVTLRDPRTRWGSATRTRRLSFSWRLILAPPRALETVVVHELAHLRIFGHGPAFWALVASRIPDHRTWRTWLRDHSMELHTALDDVAEGGTSAAGAAAATGPEVVEMRGLEPLTPAMRTRCSSS
jgi:predicted metal-dependent hydrolase